MKRALYAFGFGIVTTLMFLGTREPETIIQAGFRLQAMRQSYDFVASPREAHAVSYSTRELLAAQVTKVEPAPAKRGKK
jgi:hypothetical protein